MRSGSRRRTAIDGRVGFNFRAINVYERDSVPAHTWPRETRRGVSTGRTRRAAGSQLVMLPKMLDIRVSFTRIYRPTLLPSLISPPLIFRVGPASSNYQLKQPTSALPVNVPLSFRMSSIAAMLHHPDQTLRPPGPASCFLYARYIFKNHGDVRDCLNGGWFGPTHVCQAVP